MPASRPETTSVSMRSPTIADVSECASIAFSAERIIKRVGLADEVGSTPVARLMSAATEPVAGSGPSGVGPVGSGFVAMNRAPRDDQADGLGDALEAVRPRLAEHHVVRVALGQRVAGVVERGREPRLADRERGAAWPLALEEARRGERRRPDRLLRHLEAQRAQPRREVAPGVHRVVREHEEGQAQLPQPGEEAVGARDRVLLAHEHAVHVHQPGADLSSGQRSPPSRSPAAERAHCPRSERRGPRAARRPMLCSRDRPRSPRSSHRRRRRGALAPRPAATLARRRRRCRFATTTRTGVCTAAAPTSRRCTRTPTATAAACKPTRYPPPGSGQDDERRDDGDVRRGGGRRCSARCSASPRTRAFRTPPRRGCSSSSRRRSPGCARPPSRTVVRRRLGLESRARGRSPAGRAGSLRPTDAPQEDPRGSRAPAAEADSQRAAIGSDRFELVCGDRLRCHAAAARPGRRGAAAARPRPGAGRGVPRAWRRSSTRGAARRLRRPLAALGRSAARGRPARSRPASGPRAASTRARTRRARRADGASCATPASTRWSSRGGGGARWRTSACSPVLAAARARRPRRRGARRAVPRTHAGDDGRGRRVPALLGIRDFYVYGPQDAAPRGVGARARRRSRACACSRRPHLAGFAARARLRRRLHLRRARPTARPSSRGSATRRAAARLVCAPSVGPGYDARRAVGDPRAEARAAAARRTTAMWRAALRARADLVTITSYNEWHEGTQIEPARRPRDARRRGLPRLRRRLGPHRAARRERAYLDRTALWAARLRALQ